MFIIAEIGINHNGDISIAKELIDVAFDAGCDAVKFQKRTIDKVYTQEVLNSPRESPWGKTQREQKEGLEFGQEEYLEIDKYCRFKGIEWYASAWDLESQKFLRQFNLNFNKIASAMVVDEEFVKVVASEKKHTFISTGMTNLDEIDKTVQVFQDAKCPFELMHTVSTYPMLDEDANLNCIAMLRERYKCNVGYSGHESIGYLVCIVAVVLGANSIERHITLGRSMYGSDQAASLEPIGLERLVKNIRAMDQLYGDGIKKVWPSEIPVLKKLRIVS